MPMLEREPTAATQEPLLLARTLRRSARAGLGQLAAFTRRVGLVLAVQPARHLPSRRAG